MTSRHHALLSTCLALLGVGSPRWACAAERACQSNTVEAESKLERLFPDLLEQVQSELSTRDDIDSCARVELRLLAGAVIGVSVTLPDGRVASRSVARPMDVVPMLQALLLLPDAPPLLPPPESPPTAERVAEHAAERAAKHAAEREAKHAAERAAEHAAEREASSSIVALTGRVDRDSSSTAATPATRTRTFGFELSVIGGARLGDGQVGYGAGVLSFLDVRHWLVGFEGRADGYRSLIGSDPETTLELAVLGGRRFDVGDMALDVSAGPGIAIEGVALSSARTAQASSGTVMARAPEPVEQRSGALPRLLVGARLGFSPRSVFRTFIGVDAELGPVRTSDSSEPNLSATHLPAYLVGLALGATVGSP